jgi:hypothetical protein
MNRSTTPLKRQVTHGTLLCALCNETANPTTVLPCEETGKAVHEDCYVNRITGKQGTAIPLSRLANPGATGGSSTPLRTTLR